MEIGMILLNLLFFVLLGVFINMLADFISIEFLILILGISLIIPLIITIANIIGMKKLEKENVNLEKTSEKYINNKKRILSKFRIILIIVYIIEILFFMFNYYFCICMCGYHEFKILPMLIFIIVQFIINLRNLKLFKEKEYTVNYLIKYMLISINLFMLVVVLSKNDMDKLHKTLSIN